MFKKIILLIVLLHVFACQSLDSDSAPNIILFFVDDLGWQDTSVPFWNKTTPLNEKYRTPNMERLQAKGVKFTNAYSTPVCSPTRISLITGMNAARHRVTNWTLHPDKKQPMELNHPTLDFPEWNYNGVTTHDTLKQAALATPLAQIMKDNGYYTIHAGKAHFGAKGYPAEDLTNLGFLVNIAGHAAGAPGSYLGTENFGNEESKTNIWAVPGLEKYHGKPIFLTQALTQEALLAVEEPLDKGKPFFLYLSLYGVHTPLMANEKYIEAYLKRGLSPSEAKYASMIESMDEALGSVLDFVDDKGIEKETVILFMSDNGGLSAVARGGRRHVHNAPLASGKGSIYEGGIRVPMMAYWPGVTQRNTTENTPVIIEDFFPSLLSIAGINEYKTIQALDGKDFSDLLKGSKRKEGNRSLFWHYPNEWGPSGPGIGSFSAVRNGDWKLIYFHEDQHYELYNLFHDISEQNNLALIQPLKVNELAAILSAYLIRVEAQMPRDKISQVQIPYPSPIKLETAK
ncbi:MAG: sulfatase [Flavobacteriaceae bacterium]|nr:sulfatase [Flavobacteriaceae bacterium]